MNIDTGEIRELTMKQERVSAEEVERRLEELNRAARRASGRDSKPWVQVSPQVAAIVKAGHAAMKDKKRRRKLAAQARKHNRG